MVKETAFTLLELLYNIFISKTNVTSILKSVQVFLMRWLKNYLLKCKYCMRENKFVGSKPRLIPYSPNPRSVAPPRVFLDCAIAGPRFLVPALEISYK